MSPIAASTMPEGPRRVLAPDPHAFGEVVEEHQVAVYNLCYRMLGDPREAEDAAQEAFMRAYRSLGRYDPARSIRTWLLSIAAHHSIDLLRQRARLGWEPLEARPLAATDPQPEAALLQRETEDEVRRLLDELAPEERAAIVLRYWYDLTHEEIAEATKSTVAAVRTRLFRARRRMALAASGGGPTR